MNLGIPYLAILALTGLSLGTAPFSPYSPHHNPSIVTPRYAAHLAPKKKEGIRSPLRMYDKWACEHSIARAITPRLGYTRPSGEVKVIAAGKDTRTPPFFDRLLAGDVRIEDAFFLLAALAFSLVLAFVLAVAISTILLSHSHFRNRPVTSEPSDPEQEDLRVLAGETDHSI